MTPETHPKVQTVHLSRNAYLYVRQSTMRQVMENTESAKRQYALRQRAVSLGWSEDQIVVIDTDQGQSGASGMVRKGFQQLVTEVSMNRAGIVMGLEVSRLARNSSDWYRLLEICAVTETLLLDEDGIYNPAHFNDRLLLGLKGTMSEAELHMIRARLRGGLLQKAQRGELGGRLPTGFVYAPSGRVVLDPDQQVQESIRHLFQTFRRRGSAIGVVKAFRKERLKFPRRAWGGPSKGEILWDELTHYRVRWILKSPRYAGAYCFGRSRHQKFPDGRVVSRKELPRDEWISFIPESHPGYISWEEYEENQKRLRENSTLHRCRRERTPPREGPALLQGLAVCGRCGRRMGVRYHHRRGHLWPTYGCLSLARRYGEKTCQVIPGAGVDEAIGRLLLEVLTPLNLEVALAVQKEVEARAEEVDRLRRKTLERARQEADLARRRFLQVAPENRLVADALAGEWNQKLRALQAAQEDYERQKERDPKTLGDEKRKRITALATDFPVLWNDPNIPPREKKRMVRLLIEDVTLHKGEELTVQVRYRGGTTTTLHLPLQLPYCQSSKTKPEVVVEVDRLLDHHTGREIVDLLNERGFRSGGDRPFNLGIVKHIRNGYGLKPRRQRLTEAGLMTTKEVAKQLHVRSATIAKWRREGLLTAHYANEMEVFYEPPEEALIARLKNGESPCCKAQEQEKARR